MKYVSRGIVVGALVALMCLSNPTLAQAIRGGGGGVASALVCLLSGGADCTMTGSLVFNGVTTDISTSGSDALVMVGQTVTLQTKTNLSTGTAAIILGDASLLWSLYGGGAFGVTSQQQITISTGTDTTSPTSSQVELSCTTPACSYSPGETTVVDGWQIQVCNVDAADNIGLVTSAGVVVVRGSPLALTPGECASCTYSGAIWGCR